MKVLYFGTYSTVEGYPRNRVLIEGLRRVGVEVEECHVEFWADAADKISGATGGWRRLGTLLGYLRAWMGLARRYASARPHDAIIVGYTGQIDVLLARLLGALTGRLVILDAFLSLHDTLVTDRGLVRDRSLLARLLSWLDVTSCRAADLVLLDTESHVEHFRKITRLPRHRFLRLFVGEDHPAFHPPESDSEEEEGPLRVLWFGTWVPLQGVEVVLDAARRLQGDPVVLRMVGRGQLLERHRRQAEALPNLDLDPRWMDYAELGEVIRESHVCLGIFGLTEKALRVIPCKVYDAMASGRAVITGDTAAARELLTHGEDALLVPPGDPEALAEAIRTLRADAGLRRKLGEGARRRFLERAGAEVLGAELAGRIRQLRRAFS